MFSEKDLEDQLAINKQYAHPRFTEDDLRRMAYCDLLRKAYRERFGGSVGAPFGHPRSETWNAEDFIRESEAALETGIPFKPGTPRWRALFGDPEPLPEGAVI